MAELFCDGYTSHMSKVRRDPWMPLAAILLVGPMCYVGSFGPAWWLASRDRLPARQTFATVFHPLIQLSEEYNEPIRWWAEFLAPESDDFALASGRIWRDLDIPYRQGSFTPPRRGIWSLVQNFFHPPSEYGVPKVARFELLPPQDEAEVADEITE